MPRRYELSINCGAVTAAQTLLYVTAHTNRSVRILGARIGAGTNATNQQLEATLQRIGTLGTPTGTDVTPAKHDTTDAAFAGTAKGDITASEPTYSADTQLGRSGFASLAGWQYQPYPEDAPIIKGGDSIGLRLLTASPTSLELTAAITVEEIG